MTSSAILFSGALPTQVLRVFDIMECSTICIRTFFRHQKTILQTSMNNLWEKRQKALFTQLKNNPLELGGDGRADSPGHSAKYGTYSLIDLTSNKIVMMKLVQVSIPFQNIIIYLYMFVYNRVMKLVVATIWRKRDCRELFKHYNQNLSIGVLVTDRHKQINKWLRETHPAIKHYYDT